MTTSRNTLLFLTLNLIFDRGKPVWVFIGQNEQSSRVSFGRPASDEDLSMGHPQQQQYTGRKKRKKSLDWTSSPPSKAFERNREPNFEFPPHRNGKLFFLFFSSSILLLLWMPDRQVRSTSLRARE